MRTVVHARLGMLEEGRGGPCQVRASLWPGLDMDVSLATLVDGDRNFFHSWATNTLRLIKRGLLLALAAETILLILCN